MGTAPDQLKQDHARLAARAMSLMMLAGGGLTALTVFLPPKAAGSDLLILAIGSLAFLTGIALFVRARAIPEPLMGVFVVLGTVLITVATHEGGAVNTGTTDNEMLYVWIALLSFNYLSFRHAVGQLVVVGLAYAWLLGDVPADEALTRWAVTMSALLVAGVLVARQRRSRDRLMAELNERARHDGLTGLLNRRSLEERAIVELARARRDRTPLGLIVLDVDRFKQLNDTNGHPAGDTVLRRVARDMERETRQVDAIARLGGDEFAVLLPGASADDARMVAERLELAARGHHEPEVTLSIGVADGPTPDHSFDTLWRAADEAMYEAKRAGGDAVRLAGEKPAETRT